MYTAQQANYNYTRGLVMTRQQVAPLLALRGAITQVINTAGLRVEVIVTDKGNWAFESNGGDLLVPAPYAENWADEEEVL